VRFLSHHVLERAHLIRSFTIRITLPPSDSIPRRPSSPLGRRSVARDPVGDMDDATGDVQPRLAQPTKRVQQPHSSGIIAYGPLRPQNEPSEHPLTDSPTHMTSQFSSGALGDSQSRFHRDPSDFRRAHHYPYHAQLGPATSDIANDRIDPRLYTGHPQTSSSHDPVMQPSSSPPFAPSSSFAHVSPTYPLQHSSPDAPPASAMHGVTSNEETAASLAFHPSHTYYSHPNSSPPHFENDGHPGEPRYRQSSSESEPGSPESSPLADDNPSSLAKGARRPYSCPYEYCGSTFERPSTLKQVSTFSN
jgi:hypothetical protein